MLGGATTWMHQHREGGREGGEGVEGREGQIRKQWGGEVRRR